MHWLSFFIGALLGWLLCWLIDFLFCRRRRLATEARLQSKLKVCNDKVAALQAQLAGYQAGPTRLAEADAELTALRAQVAAMQDLQARYDAANVEIGALQAEVAKIPDLQARCNAADAEIASLWGQLSGMQDVQAKLAAADAEIQALRGRLADMDDLRAAVSGWEAKAAQQALEIERLNAALAANAPGAAPGASASRAAGLGLALAPSWLPAGQKLDLTLIEGIGDKINALLAQHGVVTFEQLAATSVERLREILREAGPRYALADPSTWPQQAALARDGDWDAFKALTDTLKGGRRTEIAP